MRPMLITNVVYGQTYAELFLNQHLKSFLDESNIPQWRKRLRYTIFTDAATRPIIETHPNFKLLKDLVPTDIVTFEWPDKPVDKYNQRYGILAQTFPECVAKALDGRTYLSALVADAVVAKGFLTSMFEKLDAGYDSVFVMPMRSAAESIIPHLNIEPQAYVPKELCRLAYTHMHPLWTACHYKAAQFTTRPFSLLWNTGTGLMVRSYSITPIAFMPTRAMMKQMIIDVEVPAMCTNPYWATDWTDAPIILVEPLFCFYPTFANHTASPDWIKEWAIRSRLHPHQKNYLEEKLYYPDKETVCSDTILDFAIRTESDTVVRELMRE